MYHLFYNILFGMSFALMAHGIFSILSLKQGALDFPNNYIGIYKPINYMSVAQFIEGQAKRRWIQYLIFRTSPIFVSSIFSLVLTQRAFGQSVRDLIVAAGFGFVLFYSKDFYLFMRGRFGYKFFSA